MHTRNAKALPRIFPILATGLVLVVNYSAITIPALTAGPYEDLLTLLASLFGAAGMLYAGYKLRLRASKLAAAWLMMGLAQCFSAAGDLLWFVYNEMMHINPSPSLADGFYLMFYPLFLVGVLLLPYRVDTRINTTKRILDLLVILLTSVLLLINLLLGPILSGGASDKLLVAINLSYPAGDMLLLAAVFTLFYRPMELPHREPVWLLTSGLAAIIGYDILYAYWASIGQYSSALFDLLYTFGLLQFGWAGLLQAQLESAPEPRSFLNLPFHYKLPGLKYLPYAWVVVAYLFLLAGDLGQPPMPVKYLMLFVGSITALVVIRQVITLVEVDSLSDRLRELLARERFQTLALEQANRQLQKEIQERQKVEERLSFDALHDALTGLPNRTLFVDRLGQAGRMKKRNEDFHYAVLFLDLDSFKVVNDSLGHNAGDQLLVRTARILEGCVRSSDTVARLGGDEFVILLEDLDAPTEASAAAERLQQALLEPIDLESTRVFVTASIGVVDQMEQYERPEDILRDADLAMYQAKMRGKARHAVFCETMRDNAMTRMMLENDLRRALEQKEFVLYYQPILKLPGRQLVGMEALVRWNHPTLGLMMPVEFIPVAEETGMILPLGEWILNEACRQARTWQERFPKEDGLRVSVNISGRQLKQPDFLQVVAQALSSSGLDPYRLALEVTESVCLDNLDMAAATLDALKALGVETQIDDFGTGYSALSYLHRLPVHSIKIDRSFIQSITTLPHQEIEMEPLSLAKAGKTQLEIGPNASGAPGSFTPDVVRAIFGMLNDLGIQAVAEGIETEVQLAELIRLKCDYVQGFLLAAPMNPEQAGAWVELRK